MKQIILFLAFSFLSVQLSGESVVRYYYDAAGNRISRISTEDSQAQQSAPVSKVNIPEESSETDLKAAVPENTRSDVRPESDRETNQDNGHEEEE